MQAIERRIQSIEKKIEALEEKAGLGSTIEIGERAERTWKVTNHGNYR